jgi:uncharacterized membrane protein
MLWLAIVARGFYRSQLGNLLSPNPNWIAAGVFYLLFVAGLLYFAVVPGLQAESLSKTLISGVLLGLLTYATYDLTNLATLKNWPVILTAVDMAWGMFLAGATSGLAYLIGRWLG